MALELSLSYSQSNNAVTLTLTDGAGEYTVNNTTGWGSLNPDYADIIVSTLTTPGSYHLLLDVEVTDKNNASTTYDTINLRDHTGADFTSASELTWDFTPADFVSGGTGMGLATDRLTDGVYTVTYSLVAADDHTTDIVTPLEQLLLIDGDVRYDVYNKLRQVPTDYDCEYNRKSYEIMEALLAYTYLQAIGASAAVSMQDELVTMLWTLDKMVSNGSKYTW